MVAMTNIEIKNKIDFLNRQIEECLSPNIFTLNNTVLSLQKEIDSLQRSCDHVYQDGYCLYCYKAKEEE